MAGAGATTVGGSTTESTIDGGTIFRSPGFPGLLLLIGTVISADMDRIAQMQPNNTARFVRVDMAEALAARADYKARLDSLRAALAP
jgi:hypothetical protein